MQITKLGHCCLLIDLNGAPNSRPFRILTDQDHFHLDSIKRVLANNPNATVIANGSVGKLLVAAGLAFRKVADGEEAEVAAAGSGGSGASASGPAGVSVHISGWGKDHAPIYREFGLVENTGYFIGDQLFYPGDAFYKPPRAVDILALPVAGPWCKFSEAVDYALAVKPRFAFPVHDGVLSSGGQHFIVQMATNFLKQGGVEFEAMEIGKEVKFDF